MKQPAIRTDLYLSMRDALDVNGGYLWRGRNNKPGAQTGLGTLLMLERRGWARLVRTIVRKKDGRDYLEVIGGWITRDGRHALRHEVTRLNHPMPARLTRTTPARLTRTTPDPAPAAGPSVTRFVDPFALITSGQPAPYALAF